MDKEKYKRLRKEYKKYCSVQKLAVSEGYKCSVFLENEAPILIFSQLSKQKDIIDWLNKNFGEYKLSKVQTEDLDFVMPYKYSFEKIPEIEVKETKHVLNDRDIEFIDMF